MSKKIKKVVNKVTKAATFGLADADKLVDVFTLGAAGGQGTGILDGITGQAARDAADAQAKQAAALANQQNTIAQNAAMLQASNSVDRSVDVVAGGTAGAIDSTSSDMKRRRNSSVASQLGI